MTVKFQQNMGEGFRITIFLSFTEFVQQKDNAHKAMGKRAADNV